MPKRYESAIRRLLDPTGSRSSNRRLPSELLQAVFLLAYMCARQSLDIAKFKHEKIASVKIHWKEATGLSKLKAALTQKVFGWIWKYTLGRFELDPSAAQKDVRPDAAKLFRSKSAKRNMTQMMAAMQLHPVEDSASEIDIGKDLFLLAFVDGYVCQLLQAEHVLYISCLGVWIRRISC